MDNSHLRFAFICTRKDSEEQRLPLHTVQKLAGEFFAFGKQPSGQVCGPHKLVKRPISGKSDHSWEAFVSQEQIVHANSESVSTAIWRVPGFGAGFEIAHEPSKLQKKQKILEKGTFIFCANFWCAPNPGS